MAYFADLTPYAYGGRAQPGVVHVGWLDDVHEFPKGEVPQPIIEKLKRLAKNPVEVYRGIHLCEMCHPPDDAHFVERPNRAIPVPNKAWTEWAEPRKSYGEIRVKRGGITYAAPMCVAHYAEEHKYLPPSEFLKAVEEADESSQAGFREAGDDY